MTNSITTNSQGQTVSQVPGQPGTVTTGRPANVEIARPADPFATIPGAYDDYAPPATKPAVQTPAVVGPAYFVAPDGFGNIALWRGTGTDDDNCDTVAYRYALDALDTVLWPTLVAALIPAAQED